MGGRAATAASTDPTAIGRAQPASPVIDLDYVTTGTLTVTVIVIETETNARTATATIARSSSQASSSGTLAVTTRRNVTGIPFD